MVSKVRFWLLESSRSIAKALLSVYGLDHHFQDQWLGTEKWYLIFLHPAVVVSRSAWRFQYGNWCFVLVPCYVGPS